MLTIIRKNWVPIIIFVLVILRGLFYISLVKIVAQPDYQYHLAVTKLYKQSPTTLFFWKPQDVNINCEDPLRYKPPVTTSPFLYHSFVGKIWFVAEKAGFSNPLQVVSLIQSVLGLLTILFIYKLSQLITKNKLIQWLSLITISNLAMFSFIMNYITYDNLVNLAGAASIYYLIKFIKQKKITDLLWNSIWLFTGSLTKITFGPLIVIELVVLGWYFLRNKIYFKTVAKQIVDKQYLILKLLLLGLIILTGVFYVRNIVFYGSYYPKRSSIYERNCSVKYIKKIQKKSEKLVLLTQETKPIQPSRVTFTQGINYSRKWVVKMVEGMFNIVSHKSLIKSPTYHKIVFGSLVLAILGLLNVVKQKKVPKELTILLFIAVTYAFYLFVFVNFKAYLKFPERLDPYSGIQGRYLFPVLGPLVVLFASGLLNISKNRYLQILVFVLVTALLVYGDTFFFLRHYQLWY